jgi:hypothetical protein
MQRNKIQFYILIVFGCVSSAYSQQSARMTSGGTGYLEHLPPDYLSNTTKNYPVLIFLHGTSETGYGTPTDLNKLKVNGPPKLIEQGHNMCFTVNGVEECFIVISPQLRPGVGGWWPSIQQEIFNYILYGDQNYRIDKNRVYLTGLSLGGQGVYIGTGETEDIFAAAAVIAGFNNGNGCTISQRKIPVWGFHGTNDTVIPYSTGSTEFNRIGWCNNPSPTAELKWTPYVGVGHNAWDKAYTTDHSVQNPNLYEWFLTKTKSTINKIPIANAGADQSITLPINSINITGNGTDSDGTIISYQWIKINGPNATLINNNTSILSVDNLTAGNYTFRLTVTDNLGATGFDDISVIVNAANLPPVANAGADQSITLPINSINLSGYGTDADGTVISYQWTKTNGPNATLNNNNTSILNVSNLTSGTYSFKLTVTDNLGATAFDDVAVIVMAANLPPVVNAGTDQSLILPLNTLSLLGIAYDPDGIINSYQWSQISGPSVALTNFSLPSLLLSNLIAGTYVFRLTAIDNQAASEFDDVTVTVKSLNVPPTANAGDNKIVTLPTNAITLFGSGYDADGSVSYLWSQQSGSSVTLSGTTAQDLSVSNLTEGIFVFRLTVTDPEGLASYDDVEVTVLNSIEINLALNKSAYASSIEYSSLGAALAVDGNKLSRWSSKFSDLQWIYVDLGGDYLINRVKIFWEAAFALEYEIQFSLDAVTWKTIKTVVGNTQLINEISALNNVGRYVRINCTKRATSYGYSIFEFEVYGLLSAKNSNQTPIANAGADVVITLPANSLTLPGSGTDTDGVVSAYSWNQLSGSSVSLSDVNTPNLIISSLVEGTYSFGLTVTDNGGSTSAIDEVIVIVNKAPSLNLALNKPVTASSLEYGALTAANAIDGSITSRWSSQFTDTQWILVDLGASYSINQIKLFWEAAFARDFQIQISSDAVSWSILNSISNNTTLTNDIILDGTGQYIRIYCTKRATSYGYSIYELEVFGEPSTTRNSSARIAEYIPSDLKETSLGISIYPIPFNNHLTIEGAPTGSSYVIRSTSGDTVITGAVIKESIDTTQLSQGVYIIDVISNNIITRNKLIK